MTVKDLIEILQQEHPDRIVILSRDAEGNSYSPLNDVWQGMYREDVSGWGEAGLETLTEEDMRHGYTQEDVINGKPALILRPII